MKKGGYVYIMASKKDGVLYIGVTSDLEKRVWEHKNSVVESFASRYFVKRLVYYEEYLSIEDAIFREKQLKAGSRNKKIELIEKENFEWEDLSGKWE